VLGFVTLGGDRGGGVQWEIHNVADHRIWEKRAENLHDQGWALRRLGGFQTRLSCLGLVLRNGRSRVGSRELVGGSKAGDASNLGLWACVSHKSGKPHLWDFPCREVSRRDVYQKAASNGEDLLPRPSNLTRSGLEK